MIELLCLVEISAMGDVVSCLIFTVNSNFRIRLRYENT